MNRGSNKTNPPGDMDFLTGGGELGELIRTHDWSSTSLGPIEKWPQSLKAAVGTILHSPVPIATLWGEDGVMIYNDAYSEFAGGRHPQLLGSKVREGWAEVADFNDNVMKVGLAGGTLSYRDQELTLYRHGEPERVWMNLDYSPLLDDAGKPAGVIALVVETTDRVASERRARESEERFRRIADSAPTPMWVTRTDRTREFVNRAYVDFLDISYEEAVDFDWRSIIHPDHRDRILAESVAGEASLKPFILEGRYRRHDGEWRWLRSISQPRFGVDGQPNGFIGVAHDITEAKQAEQSVRESEARFRALVNATSDVVYRMSPDWTEMRQLDGRGFLADTDSPRIKWIEEYLFPEDQPHISAAIDEAIRTKGIFQLEHRVRRVDGTAGWTFSRAIPVIGDDGEIIEWFGMAADVTDRKRAESLRVMQNRVLELAMQATSLEDILEALAKAVEAQSSAEVLGSILLLDEDGVHLRHGAAPHLPDAYNEAIDGIAIGPQVGSCGTAAYSKMPVYVSDIATDPLWTDFRDLALSHGLKACWSTPILSSQGAVLGTFAMYYREPREANPEDLELVEFVTRTASLVIERKKAEQALREESRTLETLNGTGAALAAELDLEPLVQRVTDAGVELTGAHFGAFFYNVLDEAGESYMLYTLSGVDRSAFEGFPMPRNTAVFGPTFRGEGVMRSDDITRDPRYGRNKPNKGMPEGHLPVRSYLSVPVASRSGEVIGGLFFGHPEAGRFTERHERLMTGIAAQAAIGIDNARLYQAAQREIAERKRAEETLRESEAHLAALVNQTTAGLGEVDLEGRFVSVNDRYCEIVGRSREELLDLKMQDITYPEDLSGNLEKFHRLVETGASYEIEKRYVRPDGSLVWVNNCVSYIQADDDRAGTVLAVTIDVTDRRDAELSLRESEERLRIVQAAGGIGSFDYDLQKDDAICSPEYYALFGLPDGSPINRETWPAAIHPEDRHKALETLDRAIAERRPFDYEYRIIRADTGEVRWLTGRAAIIFDDNDQPWRYVGGNIDITERRGTEEALRVLNETLEARIAEAIAEREHVQEALRQAQKMEAVGQLTGGIAHDFNNLLTVVIGNIDMGRRVLDAGQDGARLRRVLDNAQRGAERAAALTQRLLAFSRRQPLSPKAIDANKLVMGMSDLLGRALGETVELEVVTSPGLWKIEADPNELEAAILNLAVNARDAMHAKTGAGGGSLTIETANASISEAYSAVHAEVAPGSYVVISVTDTGKGMSKDMVARAFEPFFTTKEVGKGTGLGLSQVYGFVKQSGGHVNIYSEEGEGTTVKVYLPRLTGEGPAEEEESAQPALEHGRREECVLVAEDDDDVRGYTVELLREIGYRVLEAHDGPSALRLLERQETPIQLLFTDVVMPGMSGRELAERARAVQSDLKVLYTSGYTRNAIVHGGRLDPGVDLIVKPFSYQALARKVRDMLDTGRSGRLLVVQDDVTSAMSIALEEGGYLVDTTPDTAEALGRVRLGGAHYDAIVIDRAAGKAREKLAGELRALHRDLPLLLKGGKDEARLKALFATDRCTAVVGEMEDDDLIEALTRVGVRCAAKADPSRE